MKPSQVLRDRDQKPCRSLRAEVKTIGSLHAVHPTNRIAMNLKALNLKKTWKTELELKAL
jgi:hypothetical protein